MGPVLVLVANEPRSYREVMAAALRRLRPGADVAVVDPGALEAEVGRRGPDLVVCSSLSEVVQTRVAAWVLLYPEGPDGPPRAVLSVAGHRTEVADVQFADILAALDRVASLAPALPHHAVGTAPRFA